MVMHVWRAARLPRCMTESGSAYCEHHASPVASQLPQVRRCDRCVDEGLEHVLAGVCAVA
jgi:hypothetical protein